MNGLLLDSTCAAPPYAFLGIMGLGMPEMIIIAIVVLLLFGNRLPSVMRSLGRGVVEFKKGVQGIEEGARDDEDAPPTSPKKREEVEESRAGKE